MKLEMSKYQIPEVIEFNFEELKEEIESKVKVYENLVYTEKDIKLAKADKASLNKFIKALEDKRKEVKKECLKPYEEFEVKIKELVAIVNKPVSLIDEQVKAYEDKVKEEKLGEIEGKFLSAGLPEFVKFEKVFDKRWLNATYKMAAIEKDIEDIKATVEQAIQTIEALPEFGFEAMEVYKETLNLNTAIAEGIRLADIQERKKEAEKAKAEAEAQAQVEVETENTSDEGENLAIDEGKDEEGTVEPVEQEKRYLLKFRVYATIEQAKELREFFESKNIPFEKID